MFKKSVQPEADMPSTVEIGSDPIPIDEAVKLFYEKGIAIFGHGAEAVDVLAILQSGLWVAVPSLKFTTNFLMNPAKDSSNTFNDLEHQKAKVDKLLESWPGNRHTSDFRDIVIVGIQTNGQNDSKKWDVILPESSSKLLKFDREYPYLVPPTFILGHVNLDDRTFYPNSFHGFDSSLAHDFPEDSNRWIIDTPNLDEAA